MTSPRMAAALSVGILTLVPSAAEARGQEPPATASPLLAPRVRGLDSVSRHLLESGPACSPTIARMLLALEASDLIVSIETRLLPKTLLGELRVLTASATVRHVRIRLRVPNAERTLLAVLGHELHHATEVAADREMRNARTQRARYLAIGYEGFGGGRFETDAAREAGRIVAREVAGCSAR